MSYREGAGNSASAIGRKREEYPVQSSPCFLPPNHTSLPAASSSPALVGRSVWLEDEEQNCIENLLTEEQLQLFEKENGDLVKHYEDTLDQVGYALINIFSLSDIKLTTPSLPPYLRSAEKYLIEISSSQAQLATNLAT